MCITGHIYKIIHLDSEIQYIGSTCDSISGRWRTHKMGYNKWLNNKEKYGCVAIYPHFERFGIDRFRMILINSYQVYDKKQLHVYEQLAINRTKCVNTNAAFQLISITCMVKHFSIIISEQKKLYYQANKNKAKEYQTEYYQANKNKVKEYYQANKNKVKEYQTEYRQANKERVSTKIECECGSLVRRYYLPRHKKTQKHRTSSSD